MSSPSLALEPVNGNLTIVAPANNSISSSSTWYGHIVNEVKDRTHELCSKIASCVQQTLDVLGALIIDANTVGTIFRRLNGQVYNMLAKLKLVVCPLGKLKRATGHLVGWVDTLQVVGHVDYFGAKKYKNESDIKVASRVAICVADVSGALLWMQELRFISLSKAATSLGNIRLFSFIPKVITAIPLVRNISSLQHVAAYVGEIRVFGVFNKLSMCFIANGALALFNAFSAINAIQTISKASFSAQEKTQAALNLSYHLSELTLAALIAGGVTSAIGLGVVGTASIVTAVARLAYQTQTK